MQQLRVAESIFKLYKPEFRDMHWWVPVTAKSISVHLNPKLVSREHIDYLRSLGFEPVYEGGGYFHKRHVRQ